MYMLRDITLLLRFDCYPKRFICFWETSSNFATTLFFYDCVWETQVFKKNPIRHIVGIGNRGHSLDTFTRAGFLKCNC